MKHAFQKLFSLGVMLIALQGVTPNATASTEQQPPTSSVPQLINPSQFEWQKTFPQLGEKSPEYAILHEDKETGLTTLMFRTPVAVNAQKLMWCCWAEHTSSNLKGSTTTSRTVASSELLVGSCMKPGYRLDRKLSTFWKAVG